MPNWKKLITSGSDASLNSLTVAANVQAASLTGSLSYNDLTGVPTLISSSEQVTLSSTNGFTLFSSSLDSKINIEKNRLDAILLSADADKDSFAEIVSLINSVDTTNDNAFAAFYTASTGRLSSLESYTASLQTNTLVSGSSQIDITNTAGFTSFSSSIDNHLDSQIELLSSSAHTARLTGATSASSHEQRVALIDNLSSSAHIQRESLKYTDTDTLSYINSIGVISGSSQINTGSFSGSFYGDGSNLTGISVAEATTTSATLTNVTSSIITHDFNSYNVTITAYDSNRKQVLPQEVTLTDLNSAEVTFCDPFTGTVVAAKGGHLVTGVYVDDVTTINDTFTNAISHSVSHPFETKNVYVTVYDENDQQMIPQTVTTSTTSTVDLTFCSPSSGRVLIAKAGHIVSGSATLITNTKDNSNISFWYGSQSEYDSLTSYSDSTLYFVS